MTRLDAVAPEEPCLSVGLFALDPLAVTPTQAAFSIALDAAEPYLDDHRPGGDPLFSTVMAIEAGVSGARCLEPGTTQAWVSQVHVHKPFVLAGTHPRAIHLRVLRRPDSRGGFQCTLSSLYEGQAVTHLQAVVQFHAPGSRAAGAHSGIFSFPMFGPLVPAAKVYELFFHGPSFQVVDQAQYHAGMIFTRLKRNLPPYIRRSGAVSHMSPRIIEFALQSAGLLEVAANARMKIPHFIGSVERHVAIDADAPTEVFARASYGSADEAHINIDVVDASGRMILRVVDYRTAALPFTFSGDAIAGLRAQFLG